VVYSVRNWLNDAITTLALEAAFVDRTESARIRTALGQRYGRPGSRGIFSDALVDYAAVQHPDSWQWVDEFIDPDQPTYLFGDEHQLYELLRLEHGGDVIRVLEHTPGFPFYVTIPELRYLLSHNDHDYIIGCGDAKDWVESLRPRHDRWAASLRRDEDS
jgi:hypothetical protein